MINKKNLLFLTLFSLVLVLSVYYITMPSEILLENTLNLKDSEEVAEVEELDVISTLKIEDDASTLDKIKELKETISDSEVSVADKNKAFDAIKLLNQVSSKEELLEEKIKLDYDLNSFIKIDGDQIRVVINSEKHSKDMANKIMNTIQDNFDTKQYISVQFK